MTFNRFRPAITRRQWAALLASAVAAMALPVLLDAVVPDISTATEPVRFTSDDGSWEVPLSLSDGSALQCEPAELDSLLTGFSCEGATISGMIHAAGRDPDRTLRRMMRASEGIPPKDDEPIVRDGDLRVMADSYNPNAYGLSIQGSGDHADYSAFILVDGPDAERFVKIASDGLKQAAA